MSRIPGRFGIESLLRLHRRRVIPLAIVWFATLLTAAGNQDLQAPFAIIGADTVTREDFLYFRSFRQMYPGQIFPAVLADQSVQALQLETEALYQCRTLVAPAVLDSLQGGPDFVWKRRAIAAQLYRQDILHYAHGFSWPEIEAYYRAHCRDFPGSGAFVSAPDACPPIEEFSGMAADSLLVSRHPIDTACIREVLRDNVWSEDTIALLIRTEPRKWWVEYRRRNAERLVLAEAYQAQTRQPLPSPITRLLGAGKLITPQDLRTIKSWHVAAEFRDAADSVFVLQLVKDLFFSRKAEQFSPDFAAEVARYQEQLWRYEVGKAVRHQVEATLRQGIPPAAAELYALLDKASSAAKTKNAARYRTCLDSLVVQAAQLQLQGLIVQRQVRIVDATVPHRAQLTRCLDPVPTPEQHFRNQADSLSSRQQSGAALLALFKAWCITQETAARQELAERMAAFAAAAGDATRAGKIRSLLKGD